MQGVATIRGKAHNLAFCIYPTSAAACVAVNSSEIQNLPIFPTYGIVNTGGRQVGRTGNHSLIVEPDRLRVRAAQSPKVRHFPVVPKKCMTTWTPGDARPAAQA